jgi:hypothetical protein
MRLAPLRLAGLVALALACLLPVTARAIDPGDILLTDSWYGLFYAESATGHLHHVGPPSIAVQQGLGAVVSNAAGDLFALSANSSNVYRIDGTTGEYTTLTSGGSLQYPGALCLLPDDYLLVADHGPTGGVVRVHALTGAQTPVYTGQVYAVTASAGGVVHVMLPDPNLLAQPAGRLYRLDPATGDTVRISNTHFYTGCGLATEADGNLVLTEPALHAVKRVYPGSGGAVQLLSSGGQLVEPLGVAVEANGVIVVTDAHGLPGCDPAGGPESCVGLLYRIDPATGTQTVLSQDSVWRLGGLDVYRGPHQDTPARTMTWGRVKTIYR